MPSVRVPDGSLTVPEAADQLGIHERTLWRWIRDEKIDVIHIGRPGSGMTYVPPKSIANAPTPSDRGLRARQMSKIKAKPKPPRAKRAAGRRSRRRA